MVEKNKLRVVAIVASPRPDGNCNYLVDQALAVIDSHNIETEKIILNNYKITPCQAHDDCFTLQECRIRDDVPGILEKMFRADGVIIASPVYFWSISAQLKILLDRAFFPLNHRMPPAARCYGLIATQGSRGAEDAFREMKKFTGAPDGRGKQFFTLAASAGGYSRNIQSNAAMMRQARQMGEQIADFLLA